MTILLTGAAGFIGQQVVRQALEQGHQVVAVVRQPAPAVLPPHERLRVIVAAMPAVAAADMAGCDACLHLAASGVTHGGGDWAECFRVNVHDSLALWNNAATAGIKRFIICGSCFEYGRSGERYDFIPPDAPLEPTGAYAASKAAATMAAIGLAVDRQLELAVLRPFHVYGKGEAESRFWPSLRRAAKAGSDFAMTTGLQIRDFVPVERVAHSLLAQASDGALVPGLPQIKNVGSGKPITLRAFAEHWWAEWRAPGRLLFGAQPHRPQEVMRYVPLLDGALE